jgi:hypothetical protein
MHPATAAAATAAAGAAGALDPMQVSNHSLSSAYRTCTQCQ